MSIFKKKQKSAEVKPTSGAEIGEVKTTGNNLMVNPPTVQSTDFYAKRLLWIEKAIEKWEGRFKDKPIAQRKLNVLYQLKRKYEVLTLIAKGEI